MSISIIFQMNFTGVLVYNNGGQSIDPCQQLSTHTASCSLISPSPLPHPAELGGEYEEQKAREIVSWDKESLVGEGKVGGERTGDAKAITHSVQKQTSANPVSEQQLPWKKNIPSQLLLLSVMLYGM